MCGAPPTALDFQNSTSSVDATAAVSECLKDIDLTHGKDTQFVRCYEIGLTEQDLRLNREFSKKKNSAGVRVDRERSDGGQHRDLASSPTLGAKAPFRLGRHDPLPRPEGDWLRMLEHRRRMRDWVMIALPYFTVICVVVQLASLRYGILSPFFFDAVHADVQGIDYFSLPKAFINLSQGLSAYSTFSGPTYGDHLTWYLAHPSLAVWLGSWLSFLSPWTGYVAYTILSLGMMAASAAVLCACTGDALTRRGIWLLLLGASPTYWMYFVGNVQALPVLASGLLFAGMLRAAQGLIYEPWLFAGLLLSLLTKPVVLFALPLLLLMGATRRSAAAALLVYAAVSIAFELVPFLNPRAIGLDQVVWLALHPGVVRDYMNIYTNAFDVNDWMQDNSIHWLNLIAQADVRLAHIDVFSLPVFLDAIVGTRTPDWPYRLPILAVLVLSVAVARMRPGPLRWEAATITVMSSTLVFLLGYPTVWEYQYTSVLPVMASALVLLARGGPMRLPYLIVAIAGTFIWLPSLYVLIEGRPLGIFELTLVRVDRVVPVTLVFVVLVAAAASCVWRKGRPSAATQTAGLTSRPA